MSPERTPRSSYGWVYSSPFLLFTYKDFNQLALTGYNLVWIQNFKPIEKLS